jgi:hypothetical protein
MNEPVISSKNNSIISPVIENQPEMSSTEGLSYDIPSSVVAPVVMFSIDSAASNYAIGYKRDTQLAGLLSYCASTGFPSSGPVDLMLTILHSYGYAIRS